jgi:hypothetical protein
MALCDAADGTQLPALVHHSIARRGMPAGTRR